MENENQVNKAFVCHEKFNSQNKGSNQVLQKQSFVSYNPKQVNGDQTFYGLEYKQELLERIKSSENISQFLYYISLYEKLQLTSFQQRHFDLKSSCDKGLNYGIIDCNFCGKRHFIKITCGSFFCEECRKYLTSKIKTQAKKYIWNCNHFYATFTLPPEIQKKVERWDGVSSIRFYKNRFDNSIYKNIYYVDLVYKSVNEAIFEYCKKRNLENGFILMPHSYGSLELNFFFHINALISSKAIKIHPDKKIKTQRVTKTNNRKLKTEKTSLANFRFIFGDDYSNFDTKQVDYRFDYNELRKIYKAKLEKNFNVKIRDTPQINFAEKKDKRTGKKSIYISYKKSINKIMNYFRHIPINLKNIVKIENDFIFYRTSKAIEFKKTYKKSFKEFFNLIMQHIPPSNFRTIRQYGLYSNKNKKRLQYPTSPPKQKHPFRCDVCKSELTKKDFIGIVHAGNLVWINLELKNGVSILDNKDFDWVKSIEVEQNGRVMNACEPPDCLKPRTPPKYPQFDDVVSTDKLIICHECSGEFELKDMQDKKICKFCYNNNSYFVRKSKEVKYKLPKLANQFKEMAESDFKTKIAIQICHDHPIKKIQGKKIK